MEGLGGVNYLTTLYSVECFSQVVPKLRGLAPPQGHLIHLRKLVELICILYCFL